MLPTETNIHGSQSTFCRSSCSFFSMASSCDTFSSRWPGESLQQRAAVTLCQKRSHDDDFMISPFLIRTNNRISWKIKCMNITQKRQGVPASQPSNQQKPAVERKSFPFLSNEVCELFNLLDCSRRHLSLWQPRSSTLCPSCLLMKLVILTHQFTVIATSDEQSRSERAQSSHDAFRLTAAVHNKYTPRSEAKVASQQWI